MGFAKVRLFVDQPLGPGQPVAVTDAQAHYLLSVMRLGAGAQVLLFNGRDGEWRARLEPAGRRQVALVAEACTGALRLPPDLWLVFAPLKKARTDFIVEKAVELGAARILPVQTRFTNADRIRQDRLQAHAVEAAEQCGGTFVPQVDALQPLDRLLDMWPAARRILWCDEHLAGRAVSFAPLPAATGGLVPHEGSAGWQGTPPHPGPLPRGEREALPLPVPPDGDLSAGGPRQPTDRSDLKAGSGSAGGAARSPSPLGGEGRGEGAARLQGGATLSTTAPPRGGGVDGSNRPPAAPWAILIGPEGGFAEGEQARLRAMPGVHPVSLGPRILRADTAAVAALTLWQATLGDWNVGETDA